MISFRQYADHLERSLGRIKPQMLEGCAKFGELCSNRAQDLIGRENPEWPPLAASTVKEKEALGFTGRISATDPLLRTGVMRGSIGFIAAIDMGGAMAIVGSGDHKAVWHEFGTSKMPPRPFLSLAMQKELPKARAIFGNIAVSLLTPRRR